MKPASIDAFAVNWFGDCDTVCFHWDCWRSVDDGGGASLSAAERQLLSLAASTLERFEAPASLREKAKAVAGMLVDSTGTAVIFTGAGVSAQAGIPTYRGAAGIDTLADLTGSAGGAGGAAAVKATAESLYDEDGNLYYGKLKPTIAHTLISDLVTAGVVALVVTQNCDDLHAKGGVPREQLVELHGNVFIEFCEKCSREYKRTFQVDADSTDAAGRPHHVRCAACGWGHYTGRKCSRKGCGGRLRDTIVNFGDDLHDRVLGGMRAAETACAAAGVTVAVGSSLSVTPANSLPLQSKAYVVVNPQVTDLDDGAAVRVWSTSDAFFLALADALATGKATERGGGKDE